METLDHAIADLRDNFNNEKVISLVLLARMLNGETRISEVGARIELGLLVLHRAGKSNDILGVFKPVTFKEEEDKSSVKDDDDKQPEEDITKDLLTPLSVGTLMKTVVCLETAAENANEVSKQLDYVFCPALREKMSSAMSAIRSAQKELMAEAVSKIGA